MELIRGAAALRAFADELRAGGASVGLVTTMGALHEGHRSLLRRARAEHARLIATIFVNPLQFTEAGDLTRYPRDERRDVAIMEREGVDACWAPPVEEVYPPGTTLTEPDPGDVGDLFEGVARPGHFAGVLKVVHRLFDVVGPATAYFGEKDAQQLFLVRQMVNQLDLLIEVIGCATVRDTDGVALSSRNAVLSLDEREQAGCLFLALGEAATLARSGAHDARELVAVMAREVGATPLARLDYAAVVDEATFRPVDTLDRPARALVAARFPSARLIDNISLPIPV